MCITISNKKQCDSIEEAVLVLLRLDPNNWLLERIDIVLGDIPMFDDCHPNEPIIRTCTSSLREIDSGTITIHVSARHGQRCECPHCGKTMCVEKWVETEYFDSPMHDMATKIRVKVPQFVCKECKKYHKLQCPAVEEGHTYTKALKILVLKTVLVQTVKSTSISCKIGEWIVSNILKQATTGGLEEQDLSDVTMLFIDEIQSTHGQNYITMVTDQNHRLICCIPDHTADSVRMVMEWLVVRGGNPDNIRYVCCDMCTGYKLGVKEHFPEAKLIIDIFHLGKMVNEALDKTRKRINRELLAKGEDVIKNCKYTIFYRKENQVGIHAKRMEEIRLNNKELAVAFDLKEEFMDLFNSDFDRKDARSKFFRWYNRCRGSHIPEMIDVARRMLKRLNDILRWFDFKVTNAVSEGMNNVYKKIKSAAFGFRNIWNFISLCLFRKGNLTITI